MNNNNTIHSVLAPSSSNRWLACTPSARLEALDTSYQPTSIYAAEGTEAHALGCLKLSFMLGKISADLYDTEFEHFKMYSKYYNSEFNDYVNDYCKEVMAIVKDDYKDQSVEVYLEDSVDLSTIIPNSSGTSDVVIVGKNFVHVVDLKFGRGVSVSAINNPQLRLYAIGALAKYDKYKSMIEVRMTICQPRLYDITTDYMLVSELMSWALTYVKPRAELAYQGLGELVPGDHCMFCKYKGKCQALGNEQLATAKEEFEMTVVENRVLEPNEMTPEMLSKVLTIAPKFIDWFKDVMAYATASMINGTLHIPGYKVVEGRSVRVLTDSNAIQEKLKTAGFKEEDYMSKPELLGITILEKNIGKKLFEDLCGKYVLKPIGKPTLAVESDKRPALKDAQYKLVGNEFNEN